MTLSLLKIQHTTFTSLSIKPHKCIQCFIFFSTKLFNPIFYQTVYNRLYNRLKKTKKNDERLKKYLIQDTSNTDANTLSFGLDLSLRMIFEKLAFFAFNILDLKQDFHQVYPNKQDPTINQMPCRSLL